MSGVGTTSSATLTTTTKLQSPNDGRFATWQATFTRAATAAPGFISLEINPAFASGKEWQLVQRYQTPQLLERWRASAARANLLAELQHEGAQAYDQIAADFNSLACITEVVTTTIEPGREAEFRAWAEGIQAKQATFPGYMGTLIQAPLSSDVPYWTTLVRFAKPEQLDAWLTSAERRTLLEAADPRVSKWKSQRLASPFAGWFPTEPDRAPPASWKQSMLVLLVLFPVVMLEIRFLSPLLTGLHVSIATFVGNAISVALTSWPLIQIAQYGLHWWLQPDDANKSRTEVLGAGTVIALYAIEILVFLILY